MNRNEPNTAPKPLVWQDRVGFHAALLLHFDADGAAAMRRVGQLVYDMAVQTELPYDPEEENPTVRECRAALADLELLRDYLCCLGQKGSILTLDLSDARLCVLAAGCSEGVGRIVDALRTGLGK